MSIRAAVDLQVAVSLNLAALTFRLDHATAIRRLQPYPEGFGPEGSPPIAIKTYTAPTGTGRTIRAHCIAGRPNIERSGN